MKVKRGERSNTFCGPAALSLLTGKHVDACIKVIHAHRYYDRPVRSMDRHEIIQILNNMGYLINTRFHWELDYYYVKRNTKPTLVKLMRWLKKQEHWSPKKKYLILVTGHYVVMKGIKLFDNSNPEGVFFGKYGRRRRRVSQVWEITKRCKRPTSRPVPSGSPRQLAASL
jgi:hypothetical protein